MGPLLFNAAGRIRNTTSVPLEFNGDTPTNKGLLSTSGAGAAVYAHGLGYALTGALSVAVGGTPVSWTVGIPIDVLGRVCVELADPVSYYAGLPFTASGRLAFATAETPALEGAFSEGFSEGFS